METTLDTRLYKNDVNKENLHSLLETYKQYSDIFVAFLGAGVSASLKGVPDLKELYTKWSKYHGCQEEIDSELPVLFTSLYKLIDDKERFDKDIFEEVTPKGARATSAHIEIARAFNCFVSTNYYDPIEDGFRQLQEIKHQIPQALAKRYFSFPSSGIDTKHTLTYLHGNPQIGFCILRNKDYEYFYPSLYERHAGVYAVENSLSNILTDWHVVFLGCSFEKHLKQFIQYLLSKVERENRENGLNKEVKTHYWITSESDIRKSLESVPEEKQDYFKSIYFSDYAKLNIKPVIYSGDHIFLEDLCKTLARLHDTRTTSLPGTTYDPAQRQDDL